MKNAIYIALKILIAAILAITIFLIARPFYEWSKLPSSQMNIWVVDKTVPKPDYREHKALTWVINHEKILNSKTGDIFKQDEDYYGYFPLGGRKFEIKPIPTKVEYPDMIFLTDTYGVYQDDLTVTTAFDASNNKIYGGLDADEVKSIQDNLGNGNMIVGEFNIASDPTGTGNRKALEEIFSVNWSGWKARSYDDLLKGLEVPDKIVELYEAQTGQAWKFKGEGFVFISDDDKVIILKKGEDYTGDGFLVKFRDEYKDKYSVDKDVPIKQWIEVISAKQEDIIADYYCEFSESGKNKLAEYGIAESFPSVVKSSHPQYTSYYFAGDFADAQSNIPLYNFNNYEKLKLKTTKYYKEKPEYFYWNCYVPMIQTILAEAKESKLENKDSLPYPAKVEGKDFLIYENGEFVKKFLKGVNIGAGKPGAFPGELAITRDEYLRWFKYITEMNAQVIRVYTTLTPDFYDALELFNKTSERKLYLLQGIWIKEEDIQELHDAYGDDERILKSLISDGKNLVDILHGNLALAGKPGFAGGMYASDVSEYTIGWVMGIEWYPEFVYGTNTANPDKSDFDGKFLKTEGASPFEAFLARAADEIISYETEKYDTQRPLSFSNWPTTDMLEHPNEPFPDEDSQVVNVEHIKVKENFVPGMFASYHVYPYYPDFMNYDLKYSETEDSYKAYLEELLSNHTMPVLIAEFGIPASRAMAHENVTMGMNQGNHTESEQGEMLSKLLGDIYETGCMGGLVFTWQDEWFKRTWNTMDLDDPDARPFWSNPQTNEQQFGIMAFDPGSEKSVSYVDGDVSEWSEMNFVSSASSERIYVKSDEKYLYIMVDTKDFDFESDRLFIPIDMIESQGSSSYEGMDFSMAADFVIDINGEDNSRILVDSYYDPFMYLYGKILGLTPLNLDFDVKASGNFSKIMLCLNKQITLPQTKETIPFSAYETGMLRYGNANPDSPDFNSLSDFIERDGKIEIRIPWQLLNVMNPASKMIMDDLHKDGIKMIPASKTYIGCGIYGKGEIINMGEFSWEGWEIPTYHERLKPSYYILKEAFEKIE